MRKQWGTPQLKKRVKFCEKVIQSEVSLKSQKYKKFLMRKEEKMDKISKTYNDLIHEIVNNQDRADNYATKLKNIHISNDNSQNTQAPATNLYPQTDIMISGLFNCLIFLTILQRNEVSEVVLRTH
jgi:hypothetical protein